MPNFEVQLLGGFRLRHAGQDVKGIQSERLILLLSHLLLHSEKPSSRKQIAFLFWPDTSEEQARTNLRNLFHNLKKAFPEIDSFLDLEGQAVGWKPDAAIQVDVRQFRAALNAAKSAKDDATRVRHLQEAIEQSRGELLPGFYEDWILTEREELHQLHLNALTQLAKLLEGERQYDEAIEAVNRLIRADALNESAYQNSMRLHALNEDRAGALQVYHTCVTILKRELDLDPSPEIKALHEQLIRAAETPSTKREQEKPAEEIRLVGRKPEWGRMKEAWGAAARGRPSMLLIHGETGIGKTRLAGELIAWAQRQGFAVLSARAYPTEIQTAYAPVAAWLRNLSLTHLPEIWKTELARLLPELHEAQPAPLAEPWQRQRFHEALSRAVFTAPQPILLFLDDIQWADGETLAWLETLTRFDASARLLLLATARREDLTPDAPLHALTAPLRADGRLEEIALARFTADETARLAAQIKRGLSESESESLFRYSEGLPLFVVEWTRAGLPLADASPASLPDRLRAALAERLSTLTPLARAAADSASVFGRAFSASLLASAASLTEPDLLAALDELWQRHILREETRGDYDFSHDQLCDFIYNALTPARRQSLHQRAAKALEELEPDDLWGRASHLEKGGQAREASEFYVRFAKREMGQANYPAAQRGFAQALDLMGKGFSALRVETLLAMARVCYVTGAHEEGSQAITEALQSTAALETDPLRFQSLVAAAEMAFKTGRMDEARKWFDMAQPIAVKLGDKIQEIGLILQMADMETRAGQAHPAKDYYAQALTMAREAKSHSLEAEALEGLGFILPSVGEPLSQARNHLEDAATLYRMMGDRLREARVLGAMIGFLHAAGDYEEALKLAPEVYAKDQAVNYRRGAAIVESSQGLAAYELGQFEQARALLDHARNEFKEIGEPDGYGLHTGSLGLVAMAEQKWEEAEALLKQAIATAEENQTAIFAAFAQQDLATLYSLQGRWEDARPYFEKALATNLENNDNLGILYDKTMLALIHQHAGDHAQAAQLAEEVMEKFRVETFEEGGVIRWLWQFHRLLDALRRKEEAGEVLAKAKEMLQSAAGKIKDEKLRRSFLENFALHRELMEM